MRFLHTADWQIGMKAAHLGEKAGAVRRKRLETARRVVELARERKVDFILVAGDVFEHNGVSRVAVREVARLLGSAGRPVYVIPGNHDPREPGSVWEDPAWVGQPDVHLLLTPKPVPLPGGVLFPCPGSRGGSRRDPTAWIEAGGGTGIRIGMAHAGVEGVAGSDGADVVGRDAARRAGLDYLALGHWHSTALYEVDGAVRMAYSGAHEATAFGERDSGNVLLVEIEAPGAAPAVEAVRVGALRWLRKDYRIASRGELRRALEDLEAVPDPETALVECSIRGTLYPDESEILHRLEQTLEERFLLGRLRRDGLDLEPDWDEWLESLPEGFLREAARLVQRDAADEIIRRQALLLLYRATLGVAG